MDDFNVAMLVTESLKGHLCSRPMAIAGHDPGMVLYFLSRSDDGKLQEILRRRDVLVCMQGNGKYVSLSGKAQLNTDLLLIDRYWSADARLWFPEGPKDPDATLIVVEPVYAELWDRSGMRLLEFWWEAGKALLSGNKVDDDSLSGHATTRAPRKQGPSRD